MQESMVAGSVVAADLAPYRAASASRFLAWLASLRWHGWWLVPTLYLAQVAWSHAVLWSTGRLPVGTFDQVVTAGAVYGPYTLAALAYMNSVALASLRSFWPATGWPDERRAAWAYAFTHVPSGFGRWAVIAGVVFTVTAFGSLPALAGVSDGTDRLILFAAYGPTLFLGYATFIIAAVQTAHQLRLVTRIHREALAIDPFDRAPIYAFSRLTVQTALAYVLVGNFALWVNGADQFESIASFVTLPGTFLIGLAVFVLPLWGIHGRLVREKELLVQASERRLNAAAAEMYAQIDAQQFDATKPIADSLDGLGQLRARIDRISTWPWPSQVLRGFVSALFLPVVVYVLSRLISAGFGA
jgi:hypothetical protein